MRLLNNRTWFSAVGLALLAAWAASATTPSQKKVLIIGVDGTMPTALAVANTPNLNRLRSNGCFTDRAITHPVTHSAACWTAMFTGVWGDKSGVNYTNNEFTGSRFDLYPNFLRRLETANSNWNTVAYLRWAPLSTALQGTDVIQSFGSDASLVTATCSRLTNSNPDVFYTILLEVDSMGHSTGWGPGVTNYVRAIETADRQIGEILSALTNRITYTNEDWLVIALSDHGEHDSTLERSRLTFQIFSGRAAARGTIYPSPTIVDVCATVLTHMGVPMDRAWNLDARVDGLPLRPSHYSTNLIFNGDAEANSGTNSFLPNRGIAWWWDHTGVTLGRYGTHAAFPSWDSPGPTVRGSNFFLGGTSNAAAGQTINLADLATDIDDPGVDYDLSGWFGGSSNRLGAFRLTARFLNGANGAYGTNSVGSVSPADRGNVTCLLQRSTNGTLPAGTRLVEFALSAEGATGTNYAVADNLSFVLTPRPDSKPVIVAYGGTNSAWRVAFVSRTNRLYALERSEDFTAWNHVAAEVAGDGARLELRDPAPPPGQAFYRIACRRP